MQIKPHAAFGYIVSLVTVEEGESWRNVQVYSKDGTYKDNGFTYLFEGSAKFIDAETNKEYPTRTVGWLSSEHYKDGLSSRGTVRYVPQGKTSWACISNIDNRGNIPPYMNHLEMASGETKILPIGSNVFVCKGIIHTSERQIVAPYQLRVRSSDIEITASEDSYLLLFPNDTRST